MTESDNLRWFLCREFRRTMVALY